MPEDLGFIRNPKAKAFLTGLPERAKVAWAKLYPRAATETQLLALLDQLLAFDPTKRITVEAALAHPYLKDYYDPSDEPVAQRPFTFDMELDDLPTKQLRDMVYKEAVAFKRKLLTETKL